LVGLNWLLNIRFRPDSLRLLCPVRIVIRGGDVHNRDFALQLLADSPTHLEAINVRQMNVQQHSIKSAILQLSQGFFPARRFFYGEPSAK
jgi:hypothetical protein